MKKKCLLYCILPVLLIILVASSTNAQSIWSTPQPFTTSMSDKSNPYLCIVNNFGEILLWEEKADSNFTAIYYKKYLSSEDPFILYFESGVDLRNPQVMEAYGNSDTLFYVFFEKDYGNKTEIYYAKCAADGGVSSPVPFAVQGDYNLCYMANNELVAWISDSNLLVSQREYLGGIWGFSAPDTLYSGNITDLALLDYNYLSWLLDGEQQDTILYSFLHYQNGWTTPDVIATETEIVSLEGVDFPVFGALVAIAWTYREDDVWRINNCELYSWEPSFYPLEITSDTPFDFDIITADMITDPEEYLPIGYHMAYCMEVSGFNEIFTCEDINYSGTQYTQLSFLETESKNPKLFGGESVGGYGFWMYLVWEAYVDGYWQLYYSRTLHYYGAIEENSLSNDIQIFPNPASHFIRIENSKELNLTIRLFDVSGKLVYENRQKADEISIDIRTLVKGIYFIQITDREKYLTQKMLVDL
nr:T9SS type A sorting domain-containing protein [Bacteroidota bacterium]